MGAIGMYGLNPKTVADYRKVIEDEFIGGDYKIVDFAKRGSVCYAAVRHPKGYTFGVVALTRKSRGEFIVKLMDEASGPYYYDAPKRLISKLSPLEELGAPTEYAKEWREKCLRGG